MRNNGYKWYVLFVFFITATSVSATRKKFIWNWNQTDKVMPQYVYDSIKNFYKNRRESDDGVLFGLHGKGFQKEKNKIDGVYFFKALISHDPKYMMIIYNDSVHIIESLSAGGISAEIAMFFKERKVDLDFTQEVYSRTYEFLFDEYEAVVIQDDRKQKTIYFENSDEQLSFIMSKANQKKAIKYSTLIKECPTNIENLPYYILTQHLYEETLIILFGMLSHNISYSSL